MFILMRCCQFGRRKIIQSTIRGNAICYVILLTLSLHMWIPHLTLLSCISIFFLLPW
uniref:Uncharacterized protein n=1 Tax=Arundo donax TaxID=35708 RepID=A0A0A8ZP22_ARUDO